MKQNNGIQFGVPGKFDCFGSPNMVDSKSMVFCTVHAGQNKFTNITVKSILHFHPSAKIFIIDVTSEKSWLREKFFPIDDDILGNIEVLRGLSREDVNLPEVDISQWKVDEKTRGQIGSDVVKQLVNGDMHHSCNIQFAIDTLDRDFILIDSDAPLTRDVDFFGFGGITVSDIEPSNASSVMKRVLSSVVFRFVPYVQYINVPVMKQHGIQYWGPNQIDNNRNCVFFVDVSWGTGFYAPTGSYMFNQVISSQSQFHRICHSEYIDHFKSGTWECDGKRKKDFFLKYLHLFSNKELIIDRKEW